MNIPLLMLALAACLAIAAGIVYITQNPQILKRFGSVSGQTSPNKSIGYRSGPQGFSDRMASLPENALITFRDPTTARSVQLQVVTAETLHGRRQYHGSSEWRRSGDDWSALLCKADPSWSLTDVLIVQREWGTYVFRTRVRLGPEDARPFEEYGQKFAKRNQERGSVSMPYGGVTYAIDDIGVYDVEVESGRGHISPNSVIARFMLAQGKGGAAILIEDAKGNQDSVWLGCFVEDIDRAVSDVLTANG